MLDKGEEMKKQINYPTRSKSSKLALANYLLRALVLPLLVLSLGFAQNYPQNHNYQQPNYPQYQGQMNPQMMSQQIIQILIQFYRMQSGDKQTPDIQVLAIILQSLQEEMQYSQNGYSNSSQYPANPNPYPANPNTGDTGNPLGN